jgi:tRNA pseudouridine55 synthase
MRTRAPTRRVDGLLLVDKPAGVGSNATLQHVKRQFAAESAGHTGTLDPMASGLLIVCFGEATKFAGELLDSGKSYRAEITLGIITDTADAEGSVLERRPVDVDDASLDAALARFRGEIQQVPPMHSALKRAGRPLYEYARRGETVERAPRSVTIGSIERLWREGSRLGVDVTCSKGTYIRTLAEDLGAALGCGAHLSGLERTAVGSFSLAEAVSIEALDAAAPAERDRWLRPLDSALMHYPAVSLPAGPAARFRQGQPVEAAASSSGLVRVYEAPGRFIGTGCVESARLRPMRLLAQPAPGIDAVPYSP